jgi:RHS repeat-associated protein
LSTTTYTTVNGVILCQATDGVVHHFVPDPLGSVVMVRDAAGNTVYEAEYSPYGQVQSETGTNPSSLGFVGTLGYITDSVSSLYVRARYLLPGLGRWLTKDPLWPREAGCVYANANPITWTDQMGMKPSWMPPCFVLTPNPVFDGNLNPHYWGYGNWCGLNRPGAGAPPNPKPIDPLDACCRCHDQDLGTCSCGGFSGMAHTNLLDCAKKANCKLSGDPGQSEKAKNALMGGITLLLSTRCRDKEIVCPVTPPPCSPTRPSDCPGDANHSPCTF